MDSDAIQRQGLQSGHVFVEPWAVLSLFKRALIASILAVGLVATAWALTLEEAAERVARQHDAQVVSAHTIERDGRRIHIIRILTRDGVVRTVRVPVDRR
jgi:uncharacterized membrane protein YkoI